MPAKKGGPLPLRVWDANTFCLTILGPRRRVTNTDPPEVIGEALGAHPRT